MTARPNLVSAAAGCPLLGRTRRDNLPLKLGEAERALQLYPDEPFAVLYASMAYELNGQREVAIDRLAPLEAIRPGWLFARAQLGFTYARVGRTSEARKILQELTALSSKQYVSPHYFAVILAALGEREQALAWLDEAVADRSWWMTYLMIDPRFDALRGEGRFTASSTASASEPGARVKVTRPSARLREGAELLG